MNQAIIHPATLMKARDRAATTYAEHALIPQEIAWRLLERLDFLKLSPTRILDLGCAIGKTSDTLQRRFPRAKVFAMDVSFKMCRQAARQGRWFRRMRSIAAWPTQLPLEANSMDFIFSNLMLHSQFDWIAFSQECLRILRPDGLLLLSVPGPDTLKECRRAWGRVDDLGHVLPFIDMHDIGDVLLQQGFLDPVVDMEMLTVRYDSVDDLCIELHHLGAQNVLADRTPHLLGKQTWKRMVDAYSNDEGVQATLEVIYVLAWKPSVLPSFANSDNRDVSIPVTAIKRHQR